MRDKKMGSQDAKQKNGVTRRKTKKNWGDQMSDKTSSFEQRCVQGKIKLQREIFRFGQIC